MNNQSKPEPSHRGLVFHEGKNWVLVEDTLTRGVVFVHSRFVQDNKRLHKGDIVAFTPVPSPVKPGGIDGYNVRLLASTSMVPTPTTAASVPANEDRTSISKSDEVRDGNR